MNSNQPSTKYDYVGVPAELFGAFMVEIDDLKDLRCILRVFFLLHRKKGLLQHVTINEIIGDPVLQNALNDQGGNPESEIANSLRKCVDHGLLLKSTVEIDGKTFELYSLKTPANLRTIQRIQNGEVSIPKPSIGIAAIKHSEQDVSPQSPVAVNIIDLYENNIGVISPMVAEKLKDLEEQYPADWIEDALREAVQYNKRNLAYVEAVLSKWRQHGRGNGTTGRNPGKVNFAEYIRGRTR